ncbi:type III PLP-dependent enzyme [Streptomyces sp. NPDC050164]|uniref:type III PLP-dependent enzyme n=1 Tax=Streptomyces sp. NPDC050164 TaxID=3365605 RepID=UPI0037A40433
MDVTTLRGVVADYGSPVYVYELTDIDAAQAALRSSLPAPSTLYYSLKANPHPVLAARLHRAGCRAEISSTGELTAALEAGFRGVDCLYTGPGKTVDEVARALTAGVRRFSVESREDYLRVARTARRCGVLADCLVRLNSGHTHGASSLRMTGRASQFGVESAAVLEAPERWAPLPGARIAGVHFFPLSNARSSDDLIAELLAGVRLAARLRDEAGIPLEVVDLGGGFAAPYAKPGELPEYQAVRTALEPVLDEWMPGWRAGRPEVAFESGRYLVGTSGQLVCTVADVKSSGERTFVILDSGIHHLGGLAGLGRLMPITAVPLPLCSGDDRASRPEGSQGRGALAGPLCTPADLWARDTDVTSLAAGDVVTVPNVGAYGLTASLIAFLGRPTAAEVALDSGRVVNASRLELRRKPLTVHRPDGPLGAGAEG